MEVVCHIRPPPVTSVPPLFQITWMWTVFHNDMSKLIDSIVLNLLSAQIYKKTIPGPLVVHVFIKITHFLIMLKNIWRICQALLNLLSKCT